MSTFLLLAAFVTYSITITFARIPSPKLRIQYSAKTSAPDDHDATAPARVRIPVTPANSSECMNWPVRRLEDLCVPVIKCMCALVADVNEIDEIIEVCGEYDDIADDICDSTPEAYCFWLWWMGKDNEKCENLARDCIPFMFENYTWEMAPER
ncbi:hypothetical protein FGB62_26g012 [Gracilaria domingensis]|nr:hypothetical protein FGB62_26g020 [Gracilaria domingensis]KAI0564401.1 hypothetical protein FGB62_26g012 [Gracilaria domingensis]